MLKIGMVGAENSHTLAIAKVLNVDKRLRGVRATHVWGETRRFAKEAAEAGQIPRIVSRPEEMIGEVDAIVVDHRHGKFHLPAARPFLETGVPMFIDKPFCYRRAEGRKFLARARELKVPVCSFSTLPKQKAFCDLKRVVSRLGQIHTVISTGPCDIRSKWGGIFFYGIHQVDLILRLAGYDFYRVQMVKGAGANHSASILFRSGTVATMNLIGEGRPEFHLSVIGEGGRVDRPIPMDESPYLTGVRDFVRMFRTGETEETEQTMLGPVAVLESLEKSVAKPFARVGAGV
ncbi:MAG: Gfo/Idh/MocA family oxidoreductase [Gemmatimonadaceae bacterium]|nr:Gfo/Idh/MocA family oxidoreductase [Gemmatimonadaceae bacterium]